MPLAGRAVAVIEHIRALLPQLDELVIRGLVTVDEVDRSPHRSRVPGRGV